MKRFTIAVFTLLLLAVFLSGCFDAVTKKPEASIKETAGATDGEVIIEAVISPKPDETTVEPLTGKNVLCEIRNVSGSPCVMDKNVELDYFDDLDAITASDFTVPSDGNLQFTSDAESLKEYTFTETSPTTYQLTIVCVAGALPTEDDEQYVYMEDAVLTSLTISGTYNELVVIEYDGTSFRQV